MTFGPITINSPGASATIGIMGPIGKPGTPGKDGSVGPQGPAVFLPITAWVSGATYSPGTATQAASYVSINGSSYACTTVHTSGVFNIDLAAGLWQTVGSKGDKGDAGTPGSTWYAGSGAPGNIIGINGDYFFRTDTNDILLKVSGAWTKIANVTGPPGPAGPGSGNVLGPASSVTGDIVLFSTADGTGIKDSGVALAALARIGFRSIGDAAATLAATDRTVATSAAFTAPRTWTLPAANAVPAGTSLRILDAAGAVTTTNTLTIATTTGSGNSAADTLNGAASSTFGSTFTDFLMTSDGVSRWTYDVQGLARGGTGATTAAVALANLGGVSTAALTAALGTVAQLDDVRGLMIQVAKLNGKVSGFVAYAADDFQDQSGVDAASSSGQTYDTANKLYYNRDLTTPLLCHFDGANGATTTTDDAGHTLTMAGTAKLSTAYTAFGSASLLCDGSASGGVTTGVSTDFNFLNSSSPWTIEFVANPTATPGTSSLVQANAGAAAGVDIRCSGAALVVDNGTNNSGISIANTFVAGTKVVIAVTCDGTNLRVFTNGTLQSTTAVQGYGTPNQVQIGYGPNNSSLTGFPGYIDELRISNVCRYTASYTPATAAFALSTPALDLRSVAFQASAVPSKASLFTLVKALNGGTITPNTNVIASVSRNGGSTWTPVTLVAAGTVGGFTAYEANGQDVTGQSSGQSMKWRLQTSGGLAIQAQAVVEQWG